MGWKSYFPNGDRGGWCLAHSKYSCEKCKKAEDAQTEWGIYEWRTDGRYTRGTAIKIFKTKTAANKAADKLYQAGGNVVARPIYD